MRTRVWVPAAAGLLLVVGVLGTRGGTAAQEEDLVRAASPTVAPSVEGTAGPGQAMLTADGLDGMRLGSSGTDLERPFFGDDADDVTAEDLPGGCLPAYPTAYAPAQGWDSQAWLVDDEISAVVLSARDPDSAGPGGLSTWLGPTLGSPIQAAEELPGAVSRTEQPFGEEGPAVTVVVVPVDDVEVVYSDAVPTLGGVDEEARGRVTTIEVRTVRARSCSGEAFNDFWPAALEAPAPRPQVGLDGLATAPIGSDGAGLRDLPGAREGSTGGTCESVSLPVDHGGVSVAAVDGAITSASVTGDVAEEVYADLPFRVGMTAEQVDAAVPVGVAPSLKLGGHTVEVTLGQRVVRAELQPEWRWVDDVHVPVTGGPPVVSAVSVRDASVEHGLTAC